jgi:hypothetical protein
LQATDELWRDGSIARGSTDALHAGTFSKEMADAASRWALVASMALHVGAFTLTFGRAPRRASEKVTSTDFWAGSTFEVPEHLGDLAWEGPASEAVKNSSEINVEGVDLSGSTRVASGPEPPSDPNATTVAPSTPAPRTRAKSANARAETRGVASAHPAPGSPGSQGSVSSGAFGAEGAAAGVRDLVRSFVRAIPIVASSDPIWSTLPLGAAGSADVTLGLNGEGKPFAAEPLETATPAHLRRLVHKTLSVMSGGRFAVPTSDLPAAEQKLRIAIALTQQEPPGGDVASGGSFGLRFEPADAHRVSRAFFTLASGRRVEVSVRQLSVH